MRVLQIGMGWFSERPGGLERYYGQLVDSLKREGVEVRGLVASSDGVETQYGGSVRSFAESSQPLLSRWSGLRKEVASATSTFAPDLVATHFALYATPILRRIASLPHVVHFHGPWALESREEGSGNVATLAKKLLERRVYQSADRCIVLSRAFKKLLHEQYAVDENRIDVIPGGVDLERFAPKQSREAAREKLGWPADRRIIFCVRRLINRMGLEELCSAVDVVRRNHPGVLVMIAGKGPLAEKLRMQIDRMKLNDTIRLLGFVDDRKLPDCMRAAEMTIAPTTALEGFGLVASESLAAGTPPLVTPVGGLPEVVQDLEPELILKSASVPDLATGIDEALSGRRHLPTEGQCVEFASSRYGWQGVARQVIQVYQRAIEARQAK